MSLSDLQLSRMVAEKIYGFHLLKNAPMRMTRVVNAKGTAAGMLVEDVPLYATDPGLALEAALKVSKRSLGIHVPSHDEIRFAVCEYIIQGRADEGTTEEYAVIGLGSTLARALSLYALRAVGVECEDDSERDERGEGR